MNNLIYPIQKISQAIKNTAIIISLSVVLMALAGCGKYGDHDVSHNPGAGNFPEIIGTYKSKVPLYIGRLNDTNKTLDIDVALENNIPSKNYLLNNGITVLPIGTKLRIEHLIEQISIEGYLYYVTGSLVSGPFAGKSAKLSPFLFVNNGFIGNLGKPFPNGKRGWAVNPKYLKKCNCSNKTSHRSGP